MSGSSSGQSCVVCDKLNATCCARCKSISYCSKACQKKDWGTHELLCAAFSTFATLTRPSADHRRAVLFDPDKAKPEFIWLLCTWSCEDGECPLQMPQTDDILGTGSSRRLVPIPSNPRLKRDLLNTVYIGYRDSSLIDESRPNKSITSITASQLGTYYG